jgi:hypothetical protein
MKVTYRERGSWVEQQKWLAHIKGLELRDKGD